MNIIESQSIPKANGHYSPVIEHNGILYISGQLPIGPGKAIPVKVENQMELVLSKLDQLLQAANSNKQQVLQVRVYLSDIQLWDRVNQTYAAYFESHKPARCVVPTRDLHYGCLVELEATAFTM